MSDTDPTLLLRVHSWTQFADEDLRLARHALTLSSGCPYRLIAYHAQQCAEKYLKAFLVLSQVDFPYTHNISRLVELCSEQADWTEAVHDAEELTPFAITARYPGQQTEVTREEALRAIETAARVRDTVAGALHELGLQLPAPGPCPPEE